MDKPTRKPYRSDLRAVQGRFLKRLLPANPKTGRPRADEREVLNGILYVLQTGCAWEDRPHDIAASYKTCNRRLVEYQRRRVWQKILRVLLKAADRRQLLNWQNAYHAARVIKSKKGRTTKSAIREKTVF